MIETSFDYHIHIGQWNDQYFSPQEVFSKLKQAGKTGCVFMSTTSCAPLHPDNKEEIINLYEKVRNEISAAMKTADEINFNAKPYYWVVPLFHLSGISFEQVFKETPDYCGLKIHPLAHNWNPKIKERSKLLTKVFEFAKEKQLPIIIHTGISEDDSPRLYEKWFKKFSNVKVTLAHCRNLPETKYLFDTYPQINGDTAFIPQENLEYFTSNGYENRLIYGSDFPINLVY